MRSFIEYAISPFVALHNRGLYKMRGLSNAVLALILTYAIGIILALIGWKYDIWGYFGIFIVSQGTVYLVIQAYEGLWDKFDAPQNGLPPKIIAIRLILIVSIVVVFHLSFIYTLSNL